MITSALQIIQNFISPFDWAAIIALGMVVFVFGWWYSRRKHEPVSFKELTLRALLTSYMGFVIFLTLLGREPTGKINCRLIPLWSWYDVICNRNINHLIEIILNVVQFLPIGILLKLLKRLKARQAFIVGALISAIIEILQLLTCRGCFEWDDILHNALGCMFGALIIGKIYSCFSEPNCI